LCEYLEGEINKEKEQHHFFVNHYLLFRKIKTG